MKKKEISFEDAFIREVDEDLKNESMRKFWEKYGLYVIIAVVAALTLAVSYETVKAWYAKRAENWSNSYAYALALQNQKRYDEAIDTLDYINSKNYGIFVYLAKLQKANILFEQEKTSEALEVLAEISKDSSFNPELRDVAIIKIASYKLDTASEEEITTLLSPISSNVNSSWYPLANDILAILALRDGNSEKAIEIYNKLLENEKTPEEIKSRIKNIISII